MIPQMGMVEGEIDVRRTPLQRLPSAMGNLWRRVGRRGDGRAPLWIELAIIAWLFWLYDVINDFAPVRQLLALRDATNLLSFERSLGLDPERTLNHWLAAHGTLSLISSYYYFFAHAIVTFGVLVWLWWQAPKLYARLRTQLVIVNLIAFVVFWRYPLAPPRSFPGLGYIDVIARSHALVSWHSGVLVHDADQFAAMPSLHVAWASWCAIAIWQLTRRPAIRHSPPRSWNCSRRRRSGSIRRGASITAHGRCSCTCIPRPTSPSCRSASTWKLRPLIISN